jgi:hypothetical protein
MKIFKSVMMGFALLLFCGMANANSRTTAASGDDVITTYINAIIHGKFDGLDKAIADNAEFSTTRGENVNTFNKAQMLAALQPNANMEQDCKYTTTVVQQDDEIVIKKVEMKYNGYSRTDLVTAQASGKGWKITKVESTFE